MARQMKASSKSSDALVKLHRTLTARRDALRRALDGDLESLRELASMDVGDYADAAIDTANDELNSQLVELESRELEQIEAALAKIENGTYGRCEGCGGRIATARLNALPYTCTCIECQREMEENGGYISRSIADTRWASVGDRSFDDGDSKEFNLQDFEADVNESSR